VRGVGRRVLPYASFGGGKQWIETGLAFDDGEAVEDQYPEADDGVERRRDRDVHGAGR
jgi:hypothetical protein